MMFGLYNIVNSYNEVEKLFTFKIQNYFTSVQYSIRLEHMISNLKNFIT